MNILFFIESSIAGIVAGLISWLLYKEGTPWDLLNNFQAGLLSSSVFCGVFASLIAALPVLIMERKYRKVANYLISAFVISFSITALGSAVYSLIVQYSLKLDSDNATSVLRFFWWLQLSIGISCTLGFLNNSFKALCKGIMGLTPAFIIAGALVDKFFTDQSNYLLSFIFLGLILGICYAIAQEILKEAWLEEYRGHGISFRYYLEDPEFVAGSSDECDLSLESGPEVLFTIKEKEEVHVFELLDPNFGAAVNLSKFRYRVLVDGDKISIGERDFIYHSSYSRAKNEELLGASA